jgi:uncharacterized membrane protein
MIVGPVWAWLALKTKNNAIIYFSIKTICFTDLYFTIPFVMIALITGLLLSHQFGGYLKFSWMTAGLITLFLSAIPAIPTLRAQYKLYRLSYEGRESHEPPSAEFNHVMMQSSIWGTIAGILPLISFYLMIMKPVLW